MQNLYKSSIPQRTVDQHVRDVLRLTNKQYGEFQDVASHWLGNITVPGLPATPPVKLLPSSLQTIAETDRHTLAVLTHMEDAAHKDHTKEYHSGGGLYETGRSLFQGLWRLTPVGYATHWISSHFDHSEKATPLDPEDHMWADVVNEAYKPSGREKTLKGARYVPSVSSEKIAVYLDPDAKRIHLGVRGTKMNMSDLMSDLHIAADNRSGHEKQIRDELIDIIGNFDTEFDFDISGHSLGGLEVMNIMLGDSNQQLDRIKEVALFNPGLSPMNHLGNAKEAVNDPRFHFYLNSGDLISNGFGSLVQEDTDVHWGEAGANPLSNHSLTQWVDEV